MCALHASEMPWDLSAIHSTPILSPHELNIAHKEVTAAMPRSRNARPRFGGKAPIYPPAHEKRRKNLAAQEGRLSRRINKADGLAKEIALKEIQRLQREQEALEELKDDSASMYPSPPPS